MKYQKFMYLYPPRPEVKTKSSELLNYDNSGEYIAQPKYNGSCAVVFTNGVEVLVYNRHKQLLTNVSAKIDFKRLAKSSKWYVYTGEYLNKGKIGESGEKEVDKFVIWDLLVWNGEYLIGASLKQRLDLLEQIYPCNRAVISSKLEIYNHLCCTEIPQIYKAPTYVNGFNDLYNEIIQTDLYEGLVLKKLNSKLTYGLNELNNTDWQIKCRKETKLYNF